MYNIKFISSNGAKTLDMSVQNGIIISSVTGATGTSATLATSQGYQQIGASVQSASIEGQSLTISGKILDGDTAKKRELLRTFTPGTRGRLVWENEYFCEVWVRTAPTVSQEKHSTFLMQLYAPFPFWQTTEEATFTTGTMQGHFSFPVNYKDPHRFGVSTGGTTVNAYNSGDVDCEYVLTLKANSELVSPRLTNVQTEEYIQLNGTFAADDVVTIYRKDGLTRVVKTSAGVEINAISMLDEGSTLFSIHAGDNVLYLTATSGATGTTVLISFYPAVSGVLAHGV